MFTGIVEEIGTLRRMKPTASSCTLTISCEKVLEGTKLGDSIAVNGTCLTVTRMDTHSFDCDVTPETLSRTSFSMVRVGSPLNLERALRLGSPGRSHRARPCRCHGTTDLLHQRRKCGQYHHFRRAEMDEIHRRKRLRRYRRREPHGRKARSRPLHDLPHPTYGGEDHSSRETPGRPGECRVRLLGEICGAAHEKGHGRRSHHEHA